MTPCARSLCRVEGGGAEGPFVMASSKAAAAWALLQQNKDTSRAESLLKRLSSSSDRGGAASEQKKGGGGAEQGKKRKYRSDASLDALLAGSKSARAADGSASDKLLLAARAALGATDPDAQRPGGDVEVRRFAGEDVRVDVTGGKAAAITVGEGDPAPAKDVDAEMGHAKNKGLDSVLASLKSNTATMNTLDKSKADWESYKVWRREGGRGVGGKNCAAQMRLLRHPRIDSGNTHSLDGFSTHEDHRFRAECGRRARDAETAGNNSSLSRKRI